KATEAAIIWDCMNVENGAAIADIERLVAVAKKTHLRGILQKCVNWAQDVTGAFGSTTTKYFDVGVAAWDYPIGVPLTDLYQGHPAVRVTFKDGSTFYLDGGWWDHFFTDEDVPWYASPYKP